MNAYDIETFVHYQKHIPFCICYKFKNHFRCLYFKEGEDIVLNSIRAIFNEKLNNSLNIFYVHNLNFDGMLILSSLSKTQEYKFESFIRKMQIYSITISDNNKTVVFKCSYKLLPSSLSSISSSFNLKPKLPFPYTFVSLHTLNYVGSVPEAKYFNIDISNLFPLDKAFNLKTYTIGYCTRDVEITADFVLVLKKLLKNLNINILTSTSAPSLSLKIFIKKFNNKKISFRHNFLFDQIIRPSYYGGRCEVYGNPRNGEHIFHFDFSGMYAQCMKQKFIFGNYRIKTACGDVNKPGFYWIEYNSNNEYPILPHKNRLNNKLMFSNGIISGCYWFEEIQLFLEQGGRINKILYGIEFDNYDEVFLEFIKYFEEIRNLGSEYKTFGKLMINSLYGRLGMNAYTSHSFFIRDELLEEYEKKVDILSHTQLNDLILIEAEINDKLKKIFGKTFERTKSNISIAAAITSKARIKLYTAQQEVIKNKGRLLYSDTDSIFAAYKTNVINQRHGEIFWDMSKKDTIIKDAVFINPKSYSLIYNNGEEIVKIKGYNQKKIKFNELKTKFYNASKITIKDYRYLEKKEFELKERIIEKEFNLSFYDKRKFSDDFTSTVPFEYVDGRYV